MRKPRLGLEEAIASVDPATLRGLRPAYQEQLHEIRERFPLEAWPTMALEQYALGQENSENTFCRWLEFRSSDTGSIRGGSSLKLIIFKRRDRPGWYFPKQFESVEAAWQAVREGFVQSFELAREGRWSDIADLLPMQSGPALTTKTLHIYFPDDVLPVYSAQHLRHFLQALKRPADEGGHQATIILNRNLLAALRGIPACGSWSSREFEPFLYWWASPNEAQRAVKIAPGDEAKYWNECLAGGYICVGWDKVGDLDEFDSKSEFRLAFEEAYPFGGSRAQSTKKGNELWMLKELEPGDLVVANQGTSRVLAVGQVVEPGYRWRPERGDYRHTVAVKWDEALAKTIPAQKRWAFVTVEKLSEALLETILTQGPQAQGDDDRRPGPPVDPLYHRTAGALLRRGQVILYGPPGTGKTYTARRVAVWWLLTREGREDAADVLADRARFREEEDRLSTKEEIGALTRVTFHPSYSYEDFIEGFRPVDSDGHGLSLRLQDGVFKRVCRAASAKPEQTYVVLIDEFNRANVAKVFGEMLTLIEVDKRGLHLMLPQSRDAFSVPPNVFVLATMNTADRSIKLLDAALRRRFAFIELMPDLSLLKGAVIGELALDDLLDGLNARIAKAEGREKQIGHAYLLKDGQPLTEPEEFASRFREEILPLLQEYCYADYGALARFIGRTLVDADAGTLNIEVLEDPLQLLAALNAEFSEPGDAETE